MKRPRVFILSTSLNIGGAENNLYTIVEGLKDRCDFTVAVLKETGYFGGILAANGITVLHLPGLGPVTAYLRHNTFDIVHSYLYRANIIARVAGRIAGVPSIISSRLAIDSWRAPWQVMLDRMTDGLAHHIICNAKKTQSVLISEGYPAEQTSVIYNGVDLAAFRSQEPQSAARMALGIPLHEPVAVITARLHPEKGMDFLPRILAQMPKGIVVIAGDGPLKESMTQELAQRGLSERVHFLGWRKDIAHILHAADFMLMPSREESFPQAALEAAAAGIPVVAFDIGGMRELIDDGESGFIVSHMNFTAFASAANMLAGDLTRARRMGALAREKANRFALTNMLDQTMACYTSLMTAGSRGSHPHE